MPKKNRYAEEPLDLSSRRSIKIKSFDPHPEDPEDPKDPERLVVDNFFHGAEFWTAVIPLDAVDQIYGQSFNFSKPKTRSTSKGPEIIYRDDGTPARSIRGLNHLQSRFVLKPGCTVDLYPLDSDTSGPPVHRIADFIYSVEVVGPLGVNFNIQDGMAGNLMSAHRFLSTEEMVFERIVVENQYVVEAAEIPLTDEQKKTILLESLKRSDRAGMTERYYLCGCMRTNNCTSNPFQILDQVVRYGFLGRLGSLLYRLPINPRFYLRIRGLDSDPAKRKFVRDEFMNFINAKETQKRKRAHVKQRIRQVRAARNEREAAGAE